MNKTIIFTGLAVAGVAVLVAVTKSQAERGFSRFDAASPSPVPSSPPSGFGTFEPFGTVDRHISRKIFS